MCKTRSRRSLGHKMSAAERHRRKIRRRCFSLTESNHELHDLQTSDPFLPPDSDSPRTLEVIPVHDNVHEQIEGDDRP